MSKTDSMAHMDPATYVKFRDLQDRADAAEARLQRIAGIVEAVGVDETSTPHGATQILTAELSEIYTLATQDRPAADPLLEEARHVLNFIARHALPHADDSIEDVKHSQSQVLSVADTLLAKLDEALKPERKP